MIGFEYPSSPHARKHGPAGYRDYASYRDWLRDEFTFRCVYCLHREQWDFSGASFHIDHFVPSSIEPGMKCEYGNLLYACEACNQAKGEIVGLPNPCEAAFADCLRILSDGKVEALSAAGEKLRQVLSLNSERRVVRRARFMRLLEELRSTGSGLFKEFMGFPHDLPDLRAKTPPENAKPEGAANCYYALRERGELNEDY